jgi:hypothetical protein
MDISALREYEKEHIHMLIIFHIKDSDGEKGDQTPPFGFGMHSGGPRGPPLSTLIDG